MKLVFIENNRPLTDSVTVSETFGKRHADVLRSIENLECSQEFNERNFASVDYKDAKGESRPKYLITQDGFSFLVMGYTGKEAARFKEMYIGEFNRMRDELNKPQFALPQNYVEALKALVSTEEEKEKLALQIETDRPLVLFAESLKVSNDSILINELAKILKQNGIDIGGTRLYKLLREEGYLMSKGEQYNMPTQRSMDLKIMEVKTGTRGGSDGAVHITRTTKITGKGQVYFINKFKSQNQAM
jgi:anti-repressor protein